MTNRTEQRRIRDIRAESLALSDNADILRDIALLEYLDDPEGIGRRDSLLRLANDYKGNSARMSAAASPARRGGRADDGRPGSNRPAGGERTAPLFYPVRPARTPDYYSGGEPPPRGRRLMFYPPGRPRRRTNPPPLITAQDNPPRPVRPHPPLVVRLLAPPSAPSATITHNTTAEYYTPLRRSRKARRTKGLITMTTTITPPPPVAEQAAVTDDERIRYRFYSADPPERTPHGDWAVLLLRTDDEQAAQRAIRTTLENADCGDHWITLRRIETPFGTPAWAVAAQCRPPAARRPRPLIPDYERPRTAGILRPAEPTERRTE